MMMHNRHDYLRQQMKEQLSERDLKGHLASPSSFTMQWQRDGRLDYIVCDQLMDYINENS